LLTWLLYFLFEDQGQVKSYHVTARNKVEADQIFKLAEQRGLSPTARLVEYAVFYARGTVRPKAVPNFHFYRAGEFEERWRQGVAE
jgi:hypothetical protein